MIITNFDVQQVLRTYNRQLGERSRLSREKVAKSTQLDSITISNESKKRLLTEKITQEIINQFPNGSERNKTLQAIINQLSQEYGKPLDVSADDGPDLAFKVLDNGQSGGSLSPAENEQLKKRFIDITKSIVYDNLV
jgi:hypothetical protein